MNAIFGGGFGTLELFLPMVFLTIFAWNILEEVNFPITDTNLNTHAPLNYLLNNPDNIST